MKMRNSLKSSNGITVLALIVTVILLLILAGVSLGTIFDGDGLIAKANDATSGYNEAKEEESDYLSNAIKKIDKYNRVSGGEASGTPTPSLSTSPSQTPTPEKEEGRLVLSATSGNIVYPIEGTFRIQENTSNGALSVRSSDDSIASVSITGDVVTITPKVISVSQKQVIITVTSAETSNYKEKTATYIATIKQGGITLDATVTTRQYNGTPFDAITSVTVVPADAKVEYSLNDGEYQTTIPKITDAGEYTVAIRATKTGYETNEITKRVTINKQTSTTGNLTLSGSSGTITYPNTGTFTITNNTSNGALRVESSDTSVATASISGQTVTITPEAITESGKTAIITVTSAETSNYEAQTATYTVTVNQGTITISAIEYTGEEDGSSHPVVSDVSVSPEDAALTYSLNDGTYSSEIPQITAAGTYKVKIKATRAGYVDNEIEKTAEITGQPSKQIQEDTTKYPAPDGEWYIPKGFKEADDSGDTIKEGKVIEDASGNQFVWIPCYLDDNGKKVGQEMYSEATEYKRTNFEKNLGDYSNYRETLDSNDSASIKKYGGYYIGRYEAGADREVSDEDTTREVLIQKNKYPYNYIPYTSCAKKLEDYASYNKYDTNKVYTKLVSSYAWDTALCFIQKTVPNYATNSPQGIYKQNNYSKTGKSIPVCNIYDMGGNLDEYTSESYSEGTIDYSIRGGSVFGSESDTPAGYRKHISVDWGFGDLTMRITLYIK